MIQPRRDAFEPTHRIALSDRQVEKNQSEVITEFPGVLERPQVHGHRGAHGHPVYVVAALDHVLAQGASRRGHQYVVDRTVAGAADGLHFFQVDRLGPRHALADAQAPTQHRSEEHTSELQSLMRISYAVFCLKKKKYTKV